MAPLFDVEAYTRLADDRSMATPVPMTAPRAAESARTPAPKPVDYWVRGSFRFGETERTRTLRAIGMSDRLEADVERFIAYLADQGFLFGEGRANLVQVLGVGADDGTKISLSLGAARDEYPEGRDRAARG
jgi:hypothetical protein